MLMPSIFGENLLDDFFDDFPFYDEKAARKAEKKLYGRKAARLMKTDIKELEDGYQLEMDLPGFHKDEIQMTLEDGYLTVEAEKGTEQESEKKQSRYIRRERYSGACARSFYVGDAVNQEDIKAEFKHGILKVFVPKKEAQPVVEESKHIPIEG